MKNKKRFALVSLLLCLTLLAASCSAYKEHSKSYSKLVGKWSLNCTYVDAAPIAIEQTSYEFTSNKLIITVTTYSQQIQKDAEGNDVETTVADPAVVTEYAVSASSGKFTAQGLGDFEFNVDTEAHVAHLFMTNADGQIVHHVLEVYSEPTPPSDSTTDTTTDTTTDSTESTTPAQ